MFDMVTNASFLCILSSYGLSGGGAELGENALAEKERSLGPSSDLDRSSLSVNFLIYKTLQNSYDYSRREYLDQQPDKVDCCSLETTSFSVIRQAVSRYLYK